MTDIHPSSERLGARKLATALGLAALGAACGAALARVGADRLINWPDELAALVALVCVLTGVVSAVAVLMRPSGTPSACAWLQVATLLLAGIMLVLPMLAPPDWPPAATFAVVLALLVLQSAANLLLWRLSDELMRRVIVETGAVSFWGLQVALFAYAAAERLGLVETVTAWGLIGVLMAAYFVASTVVAVRRGLAAV